jgi:iron-sulfur cluster assembly accessory protein
LKIEDDMTVETQTLNVSISATAAEAVRAMMLERQLDETYALRLYIAGRTCSGFQYGIAFDNAPRDTDMSSESQGLKILIDDQSIQYMAGCVVDFIDDERGKGFLIENPNQLPSCSCEGGSCGS